MAYIGQTAKSNPQMSRRAMFKTPGPNMSGNLRAIVVVDSIHSPGCKSVRRIEENAHGSPPLGNHRFGENPAPVFTAHPDIANPVGKSLETFD
jgi:hypothetical protein